MTLLLNKIKTGRETVRETHRRTFRFIYGGENNNISKTDSYDSIDVGRHGAKSIMISVVRGFKKLGITTALDGSEGHLVNISKLPEYEMPTDYMQNEFTVDSEGESDTSLELSFFHILKTATSDTERPLSAHGACEPKKVCTSFYT